MLRSAFADQHPRSLAKWDELSEPDATTEQRAEAFARALGRGDLDLGKGDFAHLLAERLQDDAVRFAVPQYLQSAVRAALLPVEPLDAQSGSSTAA